MDAYIVEAKRTPIGRSHQDKGILRNIRADELLAKLMTYFAKEVIPAEKVDDVLIGCVGQHLEQGKNLGRLAGLLAGFPESVPATTINRLCGSSLQAFNFGAANLECGQDAIILAGGVEHMHHVPMLAALDYHEELLKQYEFPFNNMGLTAEKVAKAYEISRQEQDEFAQESHRKAVKAQESGYFDTEILGIQVGSDLVTQDQSPRGNTTLERLGELKTIFMEKGTVTAGNSSPLNDGASLTCLANAASCRELGLKKRAQVIGFSVVGLDPTMMGMGPVPAVQKLLQRQRMTVDDVDLFEINEAFASQSIASIRELKIPTEKVNPAGGAIALGHPLGCTGTRLITTLLHNLERLDQEVGVAAMCIGHGQGIATMIKRG